MISSGWNWIHLASVRILQFGRIFIIGCDLRKRSSMLRAFLFVSGFRWPESDSARKTMQNNAVETSMILPNMRPRATSKSWPPRSRSSQSADHLICGPFNFLWTIKTCHFKYACLVGVCTVFRIFLTISGCLRRCLGTRHVSRYDLENFLTPDVNSELTQA